MLAYFISIDITRTIYSDKVIVGCSADLKILKNDVLGQKTPISKCGYFGKTAKAGNSIFCVSDLAYIKTKIVPQIFKISHSFEIVPYFVKKHIFLVSLI